MGSSDYRTKGWWYTILGALAFVAGIGSLFDSSSTNIYLGAILIGPVMFFRGIYLLSLVRDAQAVENAFKQQVPAGNAEAEEIYAKTLRLGKSLDVETCESCGKAYYYHPEKAAVALLGPENPEVARLVSQQAMLRGYAFAPCPYCGYIQKKMEKLYPGSPPGEVAMLVAGVILLFFSSLYFFSIMNYIVTPAMAGRGDDSNVVVHWLIDGLLALTGGGLFLACWIRKRKWNPNTSPVEGRLGYANRFSLTQEAYLRLRQPPPAKTSSEAIQPG